MGADAGLERGREAYEARAWEQAYQALAAADDATPLAPPDLWRVALSAYLTGREAEHAGFLERAHQACLDADDVVAAARCAFWLGFSLLDRGEFGPATGWFGRAARLLDRDGGDHVERGYLLVPKAFQQMETGEPDSAFTTAAEAVAVGERFRDADLLALALHLQGHARMRQARVEEGLALLDEAMVGVAAGEVSPLVTGLVYCSVIGACRRVYALGRAREWTEALKSWCEAQPDLVPYRGECLVYRSELLQLRGDWAAAFDEARLATDHADPARRAAAALAFYQQGEVHRLRGEFAAAEEAFRAASDLGREPQPGLALLRLAQGDDEAAAAAIRRALAETKDPLRRARLLPACVEIGIAADELDAARQACAELGELADTYGSSVLATMRAHCRGALALAEDDALDALIHLRRAAQGWHEMDAPYEVARVRVLLARACRELGDDDTARLEIDAARAAFDRLGATPDLTDLPGDAGPTGRAHGLTPRELEVLRMLATGRTNKAIATELFISEKTVARHVSNIFAKLGLSSRAAATAYAYEHELL